MTAILLLAACGLAWTCVCAYAQDRARIRSTKETGEAMRRQFGKLLK